MIKRMLCALLALILTFGCVACASAEPAPTTEATTEPTTVPTTEATEPPTTEAPTTEAPTTEAGTRPPREEKDEGCGGIVSVGAVVAMIALGAVCIKKRD